MLTQSQQEDLLIKMLKKYTTIRVDRTEEVFSEEEYIEVTMNKYPYNTLCNVTIDKNKYSLNYFYKDPVVKGHLKGTDLKKLVKEFLSMKETDFYLYITNQISVIYDIEG